MPAAWSTGRGVNGGFVAATVVRAMEAELSSPERALRTVTVHYLTAPSLGPATVSVSVERLGRGLATLSARLMQGDRAIALALAAFSPPYEGAAEYDNTAGPLPVAVGPLGPPPDGELSPPFLHNFRISPCLGTPPFAGHGPAHTGGWIELADPRPLDAALIVALADSWWPSPFAYVPGRVPAPTIELTVHLRAPLPSAAAPVCCEFSSTLLREGIFEEDGRLRAADGTLLAQSRQLAYLLPNRSA
jgi:acyl-CoA thioesterase